MITENLSTLKIHKLTQEQYDRELAAGRIDENALYLTPDEAVDLSEYATATEVTELKTLVGDTSVSDQISAAIENLNDLQVDSTLSNEGQAADAKAAGDAIADLSSQLEELSFDVLPISRGGTGNTVGYIHTGAKAGTTVGWGATAEGENVTASGSLSHAEGGSTIASGGNAHAEGYGSKATGANSHAEGGGSEASAQNSHAEGNFTKAIGVNSHAEGNGAEAHGVDSHAEGRYAKAYGEGSHAEGNNTEAHELFSHAEGYRTRARGVYSHAEGDSAEANGRQSHAEGASTKALGSASHAEGSKTEAHQYGSHAEGGYSKATGGAAHAEGGHYKVFDETGTYTAMGGGGTLASGNSSHAEGASTIASGNFSHASGYGTKASGEASYAAGTGQQEWSGTCTGDGTTTLTYTSGPSKTLNVGDTLVFKHTGDALKSRERKIVSKLSSTQYELDDDLDSGITYNVYRLIYNEASGKGARSVGEGTIASGEFSIAEGYKTTAQGSYSRAEGLHSKATVEGAHAEGYQTEATGKYAHSEGRTTKAQSYCSHAEGFGTTVSADYGHAEGNTAVVSARAAHAEGEQTTAAGQRSHAEGYYTKATADAQHVQGRYNIEDTAKTYAHIVGNGNSTKRSNAHTIDWDGNAWFAGAINVEDKATTLSNIGAAASLHIHNDIYYTKEEVDNHHPVYAAEESVNTSTEVINADTLGGQLPSAFATASHTQAIGTITGLTDYVVANGTSGVWSYWKFNSGLCIAMGTPTVTWGTYSSLTTGQYRSTTALDLTGIFTAVMGGTCSNAHRFVNCFVIPSGSTSAELWATSAANAATSNFTTSMKVVLFGKWK